MNGTVLFPFDINATGFSAYYYALELARKINHNLQVVSTFQQPVVDRSFFRWNGNDKSEEARKQLHLKLLQLNGIYQGKYNRWQSFKGTKVKSSMYPGNIEEVLLSLIKKKTSALLLCDYNTFTNKLLPFDFVNRTEDINYKLWVMPSGIEGFVLKPELENDFFNLKKREVFGDFLWQTKLYNLPNDNALIKSEYRIAANSGSIN